MLDGQRRDQQDDQGGQLRDCRDEHQVERQRSVENRAGAADGSLSSTAASRQRLAQ